MTAPFTPPLTTEELIILFPSLSSIELIKSGGEGTVCKAFDSEVGSLVAIKVYSPNHLKSRTNLEVTKLSRINNPYITTLHKYGEISIRDTTCYYTETSYVEGCDLRHLLNDKYTFSAYDVAQLLKCISSSIDALWSEKVVHCDIKPDNILKSDSNYTLIDLGMAKHLDAKTVTAAGMIMGTMGYLAPEQFNGRKNLTLKSDYYSLGVTCYELLTGYHPYNRNQIAMLNQSPPSFPLDVQASTKLKKLILSMMSINPLNRPMNQNEILNGLEGVI